MVPSFVSGVQRICNSCGNKVGFGNVVVVVHAVAPIYLTRLMPNAGFGALDIVDFHSLPCFVLDLLVLLWLHTINVINIHLVPDKSRRSYRSLFHLR